MEKQNVNKIFKLLKLGLSRTIVILILFLICSRFIVDSQKIEVGAKIKKQYYLNPDAFDYLIDYYRNKITYDARSFKEYIYYYKLLNNFWPNSPDILSMIAYCQYQQGESELAEEYYLKISDLNNKLFLPNYNLGVIYFYKKEYKKAIKYLSKAVTKRPMDQFDYLNSSKTIFLPIIANYSSQNGKIIEDGSNKKALFFSFEQISKEIKNNYKNAYIMLVMSSYYINDDFQVRRYSSNALYSKVGDEENFKILSISGLKGFSEGNLLKKNNFDLALF